MSWILPLSVLSISLVAPMAMSRVSFTPPTPAPPFNQPPAVELEGVKQILWSPLSAAVKVNLPVDDPRLGNDSVIVIKDFVNRYEDVYVFVRHELPCIDIKFFSFVMAYGFC